MPFKLSTKQNLSKFMSIIGVYLMVMPNGVTWYWGNMAVYANSFLKAKFGPSSGTPWVISLNTVGWVMGLLIVGKMTQKCGLRYSLIFGMIMCDSGMLLSYILIMNVSWGLWLTLGLVAGMGQGFVYNSSVEMIAVWCPGNVGFVTGIIMTGLGVGAIIVTQLTTWYVNPDNLVPDFSDGQILYFSQRKVLDKVPFLFVILGILSLLVHLIGYLLAKSSLSRKRHYKREADNTALMEDLPLKDESSVTTEHEGHGENFGHNDSTTPAVVKSLDTTEIVKAMSFYIMWLDAFFADYAFDVIMNFYKLYGEVHIKDDHFLADLGTYVVISNMVSTAIWGLLFDKVGFKYSVVIFMSLLSILFSFVCFTPMLNRFLFSLFAMVLAGTSIGTYMIFSLGTLKLYGPIHFSQNAGLVMSSTVVVNIFAPKAMMFFLQTFGWFYLFLSAALGPGAVLLLSVIFFPKS